MMFTSYLLLYKTHGPHGVLFFYAGLVNKLHFTDTSLTCHTRRGVGLVRIYGPVPAKPTARRIHRVRWKTVFLFVTEYYWVGAVLVFAPWPI